MQYGDLAAYFRVWLQKLLPEESQQGLVWEYRGDASAAAIPKSKKGLSFDDSYLAQLSSIFSECQRVMRSDTGRLIFTFHHWKAVAWAVLTLALRNSEFALANYYVAYSENPISVHIANLRSLKHDAILVLAHKSSHSGQEWSLLKVVNTSESKECCANCAQILGALLSSTLSALEVLSVWEERLA